MNSLPPINGKVDVEALLRMAVDRSAGGRSTLVRTISEFYLGDETSLTSREIALTFDILYKLIHGVEMRVRRDLAQRLAIRQDVPRELIVTFANDQIDVAYPILVGSAQLSDADLVAVTRDKAIAHQIAITLREHVSTVVSEALVATDNVDVIDSLLRNPAAKLSDATMTNLVAMSRNKAPLRRPLLQRPDLDQALAWQMYEWVGEALKGFIADKFPEGIDQIDQEIDKSTQGAISRAQSLPTTPQKTDRAANVVTLVQSLRDQDLENFESQFAKLARIDPLTMPMIVYNPGGEPFAIACKACNFSTRDFEEICRLLTNVLAEGRDDDIPDIPSIRGYYDQLDAGAARKIVSEWRQAPAAAWRNSS